MNSSNSYAMNNLGKKAAAYHCARMDSCLSEPSAGLLAESLDADDLRGFVEVLNRETPGDSPPLDVNEELPERESSTVLHLAVAAGKRDFAVALLKHKEANPNLPHK